jgi:AraC-like DNA-binding protein
MATMDKHAPRAAEGPSVLAPAATGAVDFFAAHGGDADVIFGRAGILPESVADPTLGLSLASYCGLFEEAARQTRHDNLGLWFGNQFRPRDLGMLGYAAVCSPSLASALRNLVELFDYHQQGSTMRLCRRGGMLALEYQIHDGRILSRRQDAELSLGMFLNIFREAHGPAWSPLEVHFEHPEPLEPKEHEKAFDAPVYFGQPSNALLFDAGVLEARMPGADLRLLAIVQTCLINLRANRGDAPVPLLETVRNHLRRRLPDGCPGIAEVAPELGVSVATLKRLLAAEGTDFRRLIEDVREELALLYLRQAHLSLSEIAFLLGYSDLSAFSRAFRRWQGVCPRTFRDRLRGR